MLQHSMKELDHEGWVKCGVCGYCAKGDELVQYYQEEEATRAIPRKSEAEEQNSRRKNLTHKEPYGSKSSNKGTEGND